MKYTFWETIKLIIRTTITEIDAAFALWRDK